VLDKGARSPADTVGLFGLTCGDNATGPAAAVVDRRHRASPATSSTPARSPVGAASFSVDYASFVYRLPAPASWRYTRIDLADPDAGFVEAGCLLDGLSESFTYNFVPGGSIQVVDRSRVAPTSSGMTLTWDDNQFRRVDLTFQWVARRSATA
jgi:hypothetical protein